MKKSIIIFILVFFIIFNLFSQDLSGIGEDLEKFLNELGSEILPNMQQNELSGGGVWSADFNNDRKWFLSMSTGVNFSDGLFSFLEPDSDIFQNFEVYDFVQDALNEAPSIFNDNFRKFQDFFPYPNARIAGGFNFLWNTDVIILFSFWPGGLTKAIAEKAGIPGFELSSLNLGIRIRKVLLEDHLAFPAISLGIGYTFANFHTAYDFPPFPQPWDNNDPPVTIMELDGKLAMDTILNTVGLNLTVSKKIGIFVPFGGVSAWYQWAKFNGGISDYSAIVYSSGSETMHSEEDSLSTEVKINELVILFDTGFELVLGRFVICPYATYSLSTKNFTGNIEMRLEFGG